MLSSNVEDFKKAYFEACEFLIPYITYDTCKKIALLNKGYDPDLFDFVNYIKKSSARYEKIFLNKPKLGSRWLEIGALFPAFPIALSVLGFNVSVVEEYLYYPEEIQEMYNVISEKYNISFINNNLSATHVNLNDIYDQISLMGVIEHLPYTPKVLLENIHNHLKMKGKFYLDTPNFHYINNIIRFFKGEHIQVPIKNFYDSKIPFVGHHREYNSSDLRFVLEKSGFLLKKEEFFNYSLEISYKDVSSLFTYLIIPKIIKNFREIIFIECEKI